MLQGWHDLASLHWRYDPADVQRLLPAGFRVDTFDGSAWVGLLPFHMRRIRVPGLPPFGPLSTFPETNVRTYLVDPRGRRGVWFCTAAASRIQVRVGQRLAPDEVTDLDHFVSARWALGSTMLGRLRWAEVEHEPWPLHRAELVDLDESLVTAAGLPAPAGPPHVLWSPGVEVRIGPPRRPADRPGEG